MSKKLKIAITGGIGSGKSTVCDVFNSKGYTIINADQISKEFLASSEKIQKEVKKHFGKAAILDGKPNKEYLAEKVFDDIENLKKLNSILHPPTIQKIKEMMRQDLQRKNIVFVEAALIYEAKMQDMFDYVLVIAAPDDDRIKRLMDRDNSSREKILSRMKNQIPQEEKKKLADFVIENNRSLVELKIKSEFFLKIFENMTS